ncbi:MAG: hypothetical protein J6N15_08420 [Ruminiclostridium sp.]|nr:hypothetical protein [Ruminiclostridium sp.]
MAKRKRKFIKMRVEEESTLSRDELNSKLDALIDSQYRRNLNKLKGSPLCLWQHAGEDCFKLRYYHSYREDMCDMMMTIDVEKGMERCSVHGFIHKPAGIWACFWGVIASVFIDFLVLSWLLLFTESFDLSKGLMVSGAICLVRVYICLALLELDRNKVKILREELYRVIRDKPAEKTAEDEEDDT